MYTLSHRGPNLLWLQRRLATRLCELLWSGWDSAFSLTAYFVQSFTTLPVRIPSTAASAKRLLLLA